MIGYFSASIPFGLLAKAGGISLLEAFLFSALVFAGASQFMALNLLQAGVAAGEIILATFLVNSRHLVMSTVLAARMRENGPEKAGENRKRPGKNRESPGKNKERPRRLTGPEGRVREDCCHFLQPLA